MGTSETTASGAVVELEILKARLRESELRLSELQHRLTNTLQLIVALLHLQARHAHPEARTALTAAGERITAISLLHRNLFGARHHTAMDLVEGLGELIELHRGIGGEHIAFTYESKQQQVRIPADVAVNLLIVANELIVNAIKHAFPDGRPGHVRIALNCGPEACGLTVCDDGVGLPASAAPDRYGFGLRIVSGLLEHLNGRIEHVSQDHGTRIDIFVPANPNPAQA